MCGIAGLLESTSSRRADPAVVKRMCGGLAHRGPDGEGYFSSGPVAIGMRRLAIIDVAGGQQPIGNEDGTIQVVFNGEIYNFQELRAEAEAKGHRFATRSDTEVLVHLYEEHGDEMVQKLRGMFAFALWDGKRQRLLAARDRVGKKPFVWFERDGRFAFASEIAALLEAWDGPREADGEALSHYLTYEYVPAPWCMVKGLRKLPAGHLLTWEKGRVSTRRYWTLSFAKKLALSEAEWCERIVAALEEATRIRLISEVPLGAFLSGGIDSSATVALMARHSSAPVKTYSIGFEEEDYSELAFARLVAKRYGTDHHEFVVKPDALSVLPTLVRRYGEPFADASAVPSYYVARETRRHVTVALNGDGGDENFAGYLRYLPHRFYGAYDLFPRPLRRAAAAAVGSLDLVNASNTLVRRTAKFVRNGGRESSERYLQWICFFDPDAKAAVANDRLRESAGAAFRSETLLYDAIRGADGPEDLDRFLAADVRLYLADDLMVKMDIASMANSLEARSPFLDHKLLELTAQMPADLKLRGTTTKYLLKRALRPLLPEEILTRGKRGFGIPVDRWFRGDLGPLLKDAVRPDEPALKAWFRPEAISRLVEEHASGKANHATRLWALLMFVLWHREFIDRTSTTR